MAARRRMIRKRSAPIHERDLWADFTVEFLDLESDLCPFKGDPDAAEEYWELYGAEITANWSAKTPGTRPPAWWEWDAPEEPRDGENDLEYLTRLGLLTEAERRFLESAPPASVTTRPVGPFYRQRGTGPRGKKGH